MLLHTEEDIKIIYNNITKCNDRFALLTKTKQKSPPLSFLSFIQEAREAALQENNTTIKGLSKR